MPMSFLAFRKIGQVSFLDTGNGKGDGFGDKWRIMVVMALVAILNQRRRRQGKWCGLVL